MSENLAAHIARLTGSAVARMDRFPGGDISGATRVDLADGRRIVAKTGPVVGEEGRMLEALALCGAPVPHFIGHDGDLLLISHVESGGRLGSEEPWLALAEALAPLRDVGGTSYGWSEDYALRVVKVPNDQTDAWPVFWAERRLLTHVPHIAASLASRIEALAGRMGDLLPDHPGASLVHGDLWGGNVVVSPDQKVHLIDPNAYYGDREVDAATLTVFDNPPAAFFDRLELADGWRERQPIYRLWTWLAHVRLFGGSYRSAVERELDTLGF